MANEKDIKIGIKTTADTAGAKAAEESLKAVEAAAEAALAAMPNGAEKIVVLSAWNNNANFERTSPTILSFGAALGMSEDDLDNLFRLSGGLTV